ncbi:MAG TPA: hypothetical protein GXZ74_02905 [Tissierellia bacterium]|nr:hypothetical protein [Tissierellia bacterium]
MNVALNGCGRVGRALIEHWLTQEDMPKIVLIRRKNYQWRRKDGLSREELSTFLDTGRFPRTKVKSIQDNLYDRDIDVWFELTPTDLSQAERVHRDMQSVLISGVSIIFANKAPVVHDYLKLKRLADSFGAELGLSAVMGASLPGLALARYGAMGATITELAGSLNATTNFVLEQMEQGQTFEQAIDQAVRLGIAEGDWSQDIDGIDSAIKLSILASVLFERNVPLDRSRIQGIRHLTPAMIQRLKAQDKRYKLIARYREGEVSVSAEECSIDQLFYHIGGSQKILWLATKELSDMSVMSGRSGLAEVAASLQRDLVAIQQELGR